MRRLSRGKRAPAAYDADPELKRLRDSFRRAMAAYTQHGMRMRDLILELDASPESERRYAINTQQAHLTAAQQEYESARREYVSYVLAAFNTGTPSIA